MTSTPYIQTNAIHNVRKQAWRAVLNGVYALAIVSDGRRYSIGARNTTGNGVVILLPRKYEKVAHAEAVAHTKFPGRPIVRVTVPKAKVHKVKQAA